MKRTKGIMALLLAAAMSVGQVPAVALATSETIGDLEDTGTNPDIHEGTITIANSRQGETYSVYKLFDLASFTDANNATGQHATDSEAYSYVIADGSPWIDFLTNYGPTGQSDSNKYAVRSKAGNNINDPTDATLSAYFVIDTNAVTLTPANGTSGSYYVVTPTAKFSNAWDLPDSQSDPTDAVGAGKDGNVMSNDTDKKYGVVQSFAQEALKYAEATSAINTSSVYKVATLMGDETTAPTTKQPLGYYLVGTTMGTLASLDTNNLDVNIYEKNDEPTIDKKVLKKGGAIPATPSVGYLTGDSYDNDADSTDDGTWVVNTDADFEDYVQFRTVITAQQGAKDYKLHDVMEDGLQFVDTPTVENTVQDRYTDAADYSLKVYLVRDNTAYFVPATATVSGSNGTNYTLTKANAGANRTDGCDFEVEFHDFDQAAYGNDYVHLAVQNASGTEDASLMDIQDGDKLVVTYWARVVDAKDDVWDRETATDDAATVKCNDGQTAVENEPKSKHDNDQRNDNHTILTYGNKSYTEWKKASVTTYGFDIAKTKAENTDGVGAGTYEMLAGAHFSFFKAVESSSGDTSAYNPTGTSQYWAKEGKALSFTQNQTHTNYYSYDGDYATKTASSVTDLVSVGTAEIELVGLEAGTYLVYEDKAPSGYNKLSHPIVVTIKGDDGDDGVDSNEDEGDITYLYSANSGANAVTTEDAWAATVNNGTYTDTQANPNGGVHVVNQTGQELPSTGGIGTTVFYVVGGVLLTGSIIALVTKRRMETEA